jgi:hypothetical protein
MSTPSFSGFQNIAGGYPLSGGSEISNLAQLADWLVSNAGLSGQAAAGIAAVVAGESTGSPEAVGSGGDGLIGWTPPSTGPRLTGNPTADMQTQAAALVAYGKAHPEWSQIVATNDANTAAQLWSRAEAPRIAGSDIRANLIPQILSAMGNPYANAGGTGGNTGSGGGLIDLSGLLDVITQPFKDFDTLVQGLIWLTKPANWVRIFAFIIGIAVLGAGGYTLFGAAKG